MLIYGISSSLSSLWQKTEGTLNINKIYWYSFMFVLGSLPVLDSWLYIFLNFSNTPICLSLLFAVVWKWLSSQESAISCYPTANITSF